MKRRLAFISEHASPLAVLGGVDAGGQNVYVAEICKALADLGYEIDIYTRKDRQDQPREVNWLPGIRVVHVQAGPAREVAKEKLLDFMDEFASDMIGYIRNCRLQYDLIHANFFMSGLVAAIIKKQLSIPYVITFHALGKVRMIHQKEKDAFPAARIDIEQMIAKDADGIIAECPQDKADLIEYYDADPSKITVIPCGFNAQEFHPQSGLEARSYIGISEKDVVLLQLGRIVPRKGIDNVISALKYLRDIPNLKLLVVGGASDTPDFENDPEFGRLLSLARELGVDASVTFTGRRNRDQLKYYYQAADFFISTPWYEPFGITPLEAMACGTPVIGSDVGGIKYTVQHASTGFLVPAHHPAALAAAVREGISCPEKYKVLCQNAIRRVNECFTWEIVASQADKLYATLYRRQRSVPFYLLKIKKASRKSKKFSRFNRDVYAFP
jgi:D-inositol-3-phosphate glycosyltransferase